MNCSARKQNKRDIFGYHKDHSPQQNAKQNPFSIKIKPFLSDIKSENICTDCLSTGDETWEFLSNQTFSVASLCDSSALRAAANLSASLSSKARAPLSLQGVVLSHFVWSFY